MNKAPTIHTPTGWTSKQINDALYSAGVNQAAIARELGVTAPTVSDVVKGKSCSRRIHAAIAEAIKEDVKRIWPQYYLHGTPKRGPKMVIWHRQDAA